MRLIDADELKAYFIGKKYGVHTIEYVIDQQPTVEIVRCEDCKYYEETDSRIGTCLLTISGAEVDGFCAWGEWRGDGDVV